MTSDVYIVKTEPKHVRWIKFVGVWLEVGIDCLEPDERGTVVHPDNYWVDCIRIGGVWWSAIDVLSDSMRQCLDGALHGVIAGERRIAA